MSSTEIDVAPATITEFDSRARDIALDALDLTPVAPLDDSAGQMDDALATLQPNTRRAYLAAWRSFTTWLTDAGLTDTDDGLADLRTVTADHLTAFGRHLSISGRAASTVDSRLGGLSSVAALVGNPMPARSMMSTRKAAVSRDREQGRTPTQARAVLREHLAAMVNGLDVDTAAGARDAAVLALAWSAALRRSEVAVLNLDDIDMTDSDLVRVTITDSKSAHGPRTVTARCRGPIDLCGTLVRWLERRGTEPGPLFTSTKGIHAGGRMTGRAIDGIIRRSAASTKARTIANLAGLSLDGVTGHSLRRGRATDAARHGASTAALMAHGRWNDARIALTYVDASTDTDTALGD